MELTRESMDLQYTHNPGRCARKPCASMLRETSHFPELCWRQRMWNSDWRLSIDQSDGIKHKNTIRNRHRNVMTKENRSLYIIPQSGSGGGCNRHLSTPKFAWIFTKQIAFWNSKTWSHSLFRACKNAHRHWSNRRDGCRGSVRDLVTIWQSEDASPRSCDKGWVNHKLKFFETVHRKGSTQCTKYLWRICRQEWLERKCHSSGSRYSWRQEMLTSVNNLSRCNASFTIALWAARFLAFVLSTHCCLNLPSCRTAHRTRVIIVPFIKRIKRV